MTLTLLPENHPFLKLPCDPFDIARNDMIKLANDLIETMLESHAVGLAANQVGLSDRVFVMLDHGSPIACFNPEILNSIGEHLTEVEGCLSFPDLELRVKRPQTIQVRYTDETGITGTRTMTGFSARVFSHETDHLNGVTFDTLVGSFALKRAKDRRKSKKEA